MRHINPTGKSLLIVRNNVKSDKQKYSCFHEPQIKGMNLPSHPTRGALAIATNARVGCGGRGMRKANAHEAYGEVVWS